MLFLLNDVVLELDRLRHAPERVGRRFKGISFAAVRRLGQELYSHEPLLHATQPEQARRLATLILATAPLANAALFVVPGFGCEAHEVSVRILTLEPTRMAQLAHSQDEGLLDTLAADRQVWRRLAA